MKSFVKNHTALCVFLLAAFTFLPWLGLSLFNTKGEPREAIVAVTMLASGDWTLPVSFGADIPYKPPFFAWCIAVVSSVLGGHVTEYTSRLPSAIAVIAMVMALYGFVRRGEQQRPGLAACAAIMTMGFVEVWRAGMACRVDMVLTAAMVGAMINLYSYMQRGAKGLPWIAIPLMSIAVLTKGPVGMVLPLMCAWIYYVLACGLRKWWRITWRLFLAGIASLILPALWYWKAAMQGGDEFLDLIIEENVNRMTGSMGYGSHENGVWYNFMTMAVGLLPVTVGCILALWAVKWRRTSVKEMKSGLDRHLSLHPSRVYAGVCALTVFLFYCIPTSKRSVYLLPVYPMVAYLITVWLDSLITSTRRGKLYAGVYMRIILFAGIAVGLAMVASPILNGGIIVVVSGVVVVAALVTAVMKLRRREATLKAIVSVVATPLILCAVAGGILPLILNPKSDIDIARQIEQLNTEDEPVYEYINDPMLRYYTANFYLDDQIRLYSPEAEEGWLIVCEDDMESWLEKSEGKHTTEVVWRQSKKSCDRNRPVMILRLTPVREENP